MAEAATDTLAAAVAARLDALRFEHLTAATVAKTKLCVLDYLASALASTGLDWARQAINVAAAERGSSTIIGTRRVAPRGDAALANAVLGHSLVRDDMHLGSVSHLGVVVIPPALAVAETNRIDGKQLIPAIVAGYEAGAKIGRAILDVEVAKIHRPTGITGPIAGAVAAGRLTGLDTEALAAAIGLAANTTLGYNEWAATGGSEMFFHPGFAARNAIAATDFAARAARISPTALDGPAGLLAAFGKRANAGIVQPFSPDPEILAVFFKEVPACNFAQTAAQTARALALEHTIAAESLRAVRVRVPRAAALYPGCDAPGPFAHTLQAKMSIQYNVAAALLERNFAEANYVPAAQPRIVELAGRVVLEVDSELTARFPAQQGAQVSIVLADGAELTHTQADVRPASDALVRERFAVAATELLGAEQARQLGETVDALETVEDTSMLLQLCRPAKSGQATERVEQDRPQR